MGRNVRVDVCSHVGIWIEFLIFIARQVLSKTIEHYLLIILVVIFQVFLCIFLCRDLDGKQIVPYLQRKSFRPSFWSSSEVV